MIKASSSLFLITLMLFALYSMSAFCGEITIVYTANSSGKLRECECPGDPYGGLSERVTLIRTLREREKPFLLVDAGNMVSLYGDYEFKSSSILRIMNLMKYDAAGIGRLEMYHGIDNALKMIDAAQFPLLSASIVRENTTEPVFKPFNIFSLNGQMVGIISISDSTCFILNRSKKPDFNLLPFDISLKPALDELTQKVNFIVVLSHMTTEANKRLLKDYPCIDLIVQGYGNERFETPIQTPQGVLVASGARGQFIGLIKLFKNNNGVIEIKRAELIPVIDVEEDKKAAEIVAGYYKNMN